VPQIKRTSPPTRPGSGTANGAAAGSGVFDRLEDIGYNDDEPIQLLLYGRSGTGKTTLWSTFPKPILAVICSGGVANPGELRSIDSEENRRVIKKYRLQRSDELWEVIEGIRNGQPGPGGVPYQTLAIDHCSGLQDLVLKEVLGLGEVPLQKAWGLATREQYGTCTFRCKKIISPMLDLPCNLVIVAHERNFGGDGTGDQADEVIQPFVGAALTASLSGWLNGAFDYVGQCFQRNRQVVKESRLGNKVKRRIVTTKEIEFCLRVGTDPKYAARFRVPRHVKLPPVVPDPSYDKILALVRGEKSGGKS
jgi:hypothetical protein